jgi:hypothetical protein
MKLIFNKQSPVFADMRMQDPILTPGSLLTQKFKFYQKFCYMSDFY